jgi:lysophospholipase L1-like esterase
LWIGPNLAYSSCRVDGGQPIIARQRYGGVGPRHEYSRSARAGNLSGPDPLRLFCRPLASARSRPGAAARLRRRHADPVPGRLHHRRQPGAQPRPNHILGHGYVFITAARHGATFPQLKLEFFNRGVSGNTVLDLEKRWQEDALDLKPDLLSVLVGVNDSGRKVPLDQYEQTYDRLLAQARQANPRLKLVLCEPFGLPVGKHKTDWRTWNASLAQQREVVARLAARHDAALVKFQEAFDQAAERAPAEHWIWDAVHPTYSGHQVMADAWEAAVRAKWETAK